MRFSRFAPLVFLGLFGCGGGGNDLPLPPATGTGGSSPPAATGGAEGAGTGGSGATLAVDAALVPVTADASASPPDATPVSGQFPGLTRIFDGLTLAGWEQGPAMLWSVKDGALDAAGKTGGELLMSKEDYGDFRIILSSRMVSNQSKTGHLGVCFWGGHAPVGKYNACKLLIPPNAGIWDYGSNGALAGVTRMQGNLDLMTWHQTEIVCLLATGSCKFASDGVAMLTYKDPDPARLKKGPIGLQIHAGTSEVQYKDVSIDPAPKDDTLLTVTRP
jgi:hypothetical protein